MARLRFASVSGTLSSGIDDDDLTISSDSLALLPEVSSPDYVVLVLDPGREDGPPECVYITDHVAAATTATVTRGEEQDDGHGPARAHASGTFWVHGATPDDYGTGGGDPNADLVISHDWRLVPAGSVAAIWTNGPGTYRAPFTDVNDIAPVFVQDAEVVDGALRLRSTAPANVVGIWTITDYLATAEDVRAGFLHAGFLDAGVDSECDAHASINIVLVDGAGTGYVAHFLNVYEGGALVGKVLVGRDTGGVFTEDDETILASPLVAGDICEFRIQRGSPNTLTTYRNGVQVSTMTDSSHDPQTFTSFSMPTNSATTGIKWRPGSYAQWVTTGAGWTPALIP